LAFAAEEKRLWALAQELLPRQGVEAYTQGLMDLGATLCSTRAPACERCPLASLCVAKANGQQRHFPIKSKRLKRSRRSNTLLLLRHGENLWLVQRPDKGVWASMWSLPEFADVDLLQATCAGWPGQGQWQAPFVHALTHLDWTLQVLLWELPAAKKPAAKVWAAEALQGGRWVTQDQALAMSLPAPVRRVLLA
jgi:A/G-specific adenine glycosylase